MTIIPPSPLAGTKVAEFSHMAVGPSACLSPADLGAEVIGVKPVGGNKTRKFQDSATLWGLDHERR